MILRYCGGKSKKSIQRSILKYFPQNYSTYVEPFCGGCGIFFSIPKNKKRWVNDINPYLVNFYSVLRDNYDSFIEKCREIEPQKDYEIVDPPIYNLRLKQVFDDLKFNENCDQALRYFFINRTVWGGRVTFEKGMESRLYFSNPKGWDIIKTDKLKKASEILQGTKITCLDYREILKEDFEDAVIYCDPPYYKDTLLSKKSKLYQYGFTEDDHTELSKDIKNCKHKIILSYDDHEFIRNLYSDFYIHDEHWTYCGTSSAKNLKNRNKKTGSELIITTLPVKNHSAVFFSAREI